MSDTAAMFLCVAAVNIAFLAFLSVVVYVNRKK